MEHAILNASSAKRWMSCPPSARLQELFSEDTPSSSAEEGTFAHSLAETELRYYFHEIGEKRYKSLISEAEKNEYYSRDLCEYVEEYVNLIIGKFSEAQIRDSGAMLLLEQRLDFSDWVEKGFGRGDAIIIADGLLEVCDLKYGRNIPVSAIDNPQLKLYALGAYKEFSFMYDFDSIQVTICQPRNGGVSSELIPVSKLLSWGESIKPIAKLAFEGKGDLKAGEHCRFCKAAPKCKALAEKNMEIAKYDFKDCDLLNNEELCDILGRVDDLVKYANMVKDFCLVEALAGKTFEGYKLVEGRSVSKFTDVDKVADVLKTDGFSEEEIYKPKELLGMTALKKIVGTKHFGELLSDYLEKPQGKPTLVPVSDKRPEFNSAENDFDEILS